MHPFLYPFESEERWISYLKHCLGWDENALTEAKTFLKRRLIPVLHGTEIALFLGISPKLIGYMVRNPHRYYRTFDIEKKNGKYREITAPRVFLKTVQRYILDCILSPLDLHESAVGFRRGFTPAIGAQRHIKNTYIWNIDLKDFFPSIHQERVTEAFKKMGYSSQAAYFLSGLCCLGGRLPQGAPTSPALSNYIFFELDEKIFEHTQRLKIVYTRYADDLSFSSSNPITEEFMRFVEGIIKSSGFSINKNKTRLMGPACRREVTGLTVNARVSIPRPIRRKIRARFHNVSLNPTSYVDKRDKLMGLAAWVNQYHVDEAKQYFNIVDSIHKSTQS